MSPGSTSAVAERHAASAHVMSALVAGVRDWDAPTPVAQWRVRDVVGHLTSWLPGLLGASGVTLAPGPSAAVDPAGAWEHQTLLVQDLLERPARAGALVAFPGGEKRVEDVIAEFYEPDVFMHAWDLARGSGQPFHLDAGRCAEMVAGMEPIEAMLRESGQFGQRVEVGPDASAEERLLGLIGRDPHWCLFPDPPPRA